MRFFRIAKNDCQTVMESCQRQGQRRLLLHGTGELAEIACFCAAQSGVEIVGVIGGHNGTDMPAPCFARLDQAPAFDAIFVTDLFDPQMVYLDLLAALPGTCVLAPAFLKLAALPKESSLVDADKESQDEYHD